VAPEFRQVVTPTEAAGLVTVSAPAPAGPALRHAKASGRQTPPNSLNSGTARSCAWRPMRRVRRRGGSWWRRRFGSNYGVTSRHITGFLSSFRSLLARTPGRLHNGHTRTSSATPPQICRHDCPRSATTTPMLDCVAPQTHRIGPSRVLEVKKLTLMTKYPFFDPYFGWMAKTRRPTLLASHQPSTRTTAHLGTSS
jgi:hypothetical protein